jgi:hypothetical protein
MIAATAIFSIPPAEPSVVGKVPDLTDRRLVRRTLPLHRDATD